MSGLDIEAIRERSQRCDRLAITRSASIDTWALAAVASAADVPLLLAEVDQLTTELQAAREAEFEVVRLRGELAETRAALGNVREHLDLRDGELVSANSQRDHARAALADALQVIADLRGETP